MKSRHFTAIVLSILSLCVLPSCDKSVAVTGIKLDKTSLSLTEGESANLTATIEPSNATNGTVTWSSTDATIASVNNGLVKALTAGSTTVKVTTADGAKTAECAVTVNKKIIAVTGVILDFVSDTLIVDQTKQLTAIVKPDDASDKTVSWSSSNEKIASVDATGKVTAVKAGSATITVVTNGTNASGKTELATCDITVTQPVSGVSLDKTSLTIVEGDTATLTATVSPDDASDKTISWSTSDSAIATVENGKVTAVKEGSAKITVTTKDGGKTAECAVTVNKKIIAVTGVILDFVSDTLIVDQTKQLTAIVKPDDASDKTVAWSSSNAAIASVDATGKVTAIKAGSATITVVTNGTNASGKTELATCDITVTQPVSGVSLDKTSLTIVEGDTATLTATVSPDDASDKTISWSTSDSAIATVENGKVTAVKEGSAKITVTTKDGGKTAECAITVNKKIIPVEGVTIDNTTASLIMGQTLQLTATVTPDDATDKTVSWSSSNASVAEVDADGLVSAKTAGSATITVTTTDGGKMATCDVTVKEMNINIPDANFKAYLVQNFDKNGDGEISLSEAAAVTKIDCRDKSIASLEGIQYFTALTLLYCNNNQLTSLDVTKNTALKYIRCEKNQLTSLDVSKNTALISFKCQSNQLTILDVSNNTLLTTLFCDTNQLTSLEVSNNTLLQDLYCSNNHLTNLDISNNTALQHACVGWQKDASGNLQWISVKKGSLADSVFPTLGDSAGFNYMVSFVISIPDANFKAYLVQNFDTDGDGEISIAEVAAVTDINCGRKSIASLEGIQYFTALDHLNCYDNQLTSLDVSKNTALTLLHCGSNQLTSLDVSNNTLLKTLFCGINQLKSLDVSKNTALTELYCADNQLTSLDVSKNTAYLDCYNNHLTSLDLSNNTALQHACVGWQKDASGNLQWISVKKGSLADSVFPTLGDSAGFNYMVSFVISIPDANFKAYLVQNFDTDGDGEISIAEVAAVTDINCGRKSIASLEGIQYFTALDHLNCYDNQLTSLDVSKNTALTNLHCSSNYLTRLDVSQNTALTELLCSSNQLKKLDLSNNTKLQTAYVGCQMDASGNAQTIFVKRGSLAVSVFPGLGADSGLNYMVSFVINISIPDANFKAYLVQKFDTDKDGEISTEEASTVTTIFCPNKDISSLEGIGYFTSLTEVICFSNHQLASLDLSKNTALKIINIEDCQIANLDVGKNTSLTNLYCRSNKLTSLDVSKNAALTSLDCSHNQLTVLDASTMANPSSFTLYCGVQSTSGGSDQTLVLTLLDAQKDHWNTLKADAYNSNVSVTYK